MNRRHSLKLISALPLIAAFPSVALADAKKGVKKEDKKNQKKDTKKTAKKGNSGDMLDENDTLAKAMKYKADASEAPAMRTNKKAFCYNCSKYNVCMEGDKDCKPLDKAALAKADAAPCSIFKGKLVAKNGWCLSWQPKG